MREVRAFSVAGLEHRVLHELSSSGPVSWKALHHAAQHLHSAVTCWVLRHGHLHALHNLIRYAPGVCILSLQQAHMSSVHTVVMHVCCGCLERAMHEFSPCMTG